MIYINRYSVTKTDDKPGEYAGIIVHDETGERVALGNNKKTVWKKECYAKTAIKYQEENSGGLFRNIDEVFNEGKEKFIEEHEVAKFAGGFVLFPEKSGEGIIEQKKKLDEYKEMFKHLKVVKIGKEGK